MPNICDNQKCKYHIALPDDMKDATVARVFTAVLTATSYSPSAVYNGPMIETEVSRVRVVIGFNECFLCTDCAARFDARNLIASVK